jgi:ligand-binding sensor domain-containing protein/serine phosphatase RsbU (regulator of sigma subunit)
MRPNVLMKVSESAIWLLFLFSSISFGQTYSFKNYGAESSIPNNAIYTINQSDDGFLWIGTGSCITRFDGFTFINMQYPDSITSRYATSSLKDKDGTLWFGCSDGSVFYVKKNVLIAVPISNSKLISVLIQGPEGYIYAISQGKPIFGINPKKPEEIHKYSFSIDPVIFSAAFTKSGNLLLGTQENVLVCKLTKDSVSVVNVVEGFNDSGVTAIQSTDDTSKFVLGTTDNGLFQMKISSKGYSLSRFKDHPEWSSLSIQSISEDTEHYLWAATKESGAIKFKLSDNEESVQSVRVYNLNSGLISNDVKCTFQDKEGNSWLGLSGDGISMLASPAFSYFTLGKNSSQNNIIFVNKYSDKYILGTPVGYHLFDPTFGKSISFTDLSIQVGSKDINCYYLDKDKNLWIGTAGNGLFIKEGSGPVRLFHRSGDSGSDDIKDIVIKNQNIWLATTNGVIILDSRGGGGDKELKRFDINNGLPHNSINAILISPEGSAYIGTECDRLYKIDRDFNISSGNSVMSGSTKNKILSFSQDSKGILWAATNGNGVFECINDSVIAINRSNDLMSNYCYSILDDSDNNIWIGHEKGFSRFNPKNGTMSIFGTNYAKVGVCNPGGMFESADKKIFIGTTQGLIVYDKHEDIKGTESPLNNINYVVINDVRYSYQPSFSLPYNKKYVIRVYYSGINFSAPDKVYYSTFLENFDNEWSKMNQSREVSYSLSDGTYKFNLLSVNREGISQDTPVSFEIIIKRPIWRIWWFIIIEIAAVAGIIFLIIREREKSQKKIQEYLERELEARTSVVMKQKVEIELQNIGITDSINYAKRIQSSILPDINKLKEAFKDAFILFHPRDIVSGDFYWFDKLEDDKFVIVCADSTGHGVPGAFMSMIGSTLLQDIVSRKRISKPSQILGLLDKQIFSTLNQNVELGVSNDGMDMVVCEFNVKTRHLRFASAMRPVIIVLDGEPYYIKGNRSSVGGESVIEKYFDDQEYYLNEGDTVYLFSDGLPDQFGGADGKKMKIARLKRLIEQVSKLPMSDQKEAISNFFFEWKGSYEQVDDILLMGIKV